MGGERTVKEFTGRQTRRREKKRKTKIRVAGWCKIGLDEYACKKMKNKSFRQNRMGISHERNQGQTSRASVLQKKKENYV
jgi:hypothetical protein